MQATCKWKIERWYRYTSSIEPITSHYDDYNDAVRDFDYWNEGGEVVRMRLTQVIELDMMSMSRA